MALHEVASPALSEPPVRRSSAVTPAPGVTGSREVSSWAGRVTGSSVVEVLAELDAFAASAAVDPPAPFEEAERGEAAGIRDVTASAPARWGLPGRVTMISSTASAVDDDVGALTELTGVLNELSRSSGVADFYPFVLSVPAVRKLHLVQRVIAAAAS